MLHVFQFPFATMPLFIDIKLEDMAKVNFSLQNMKDSRIEIARVILHFHTKMKNFAHNGAGSIADVVELSFGPGDPHTPSSTELWEEAKNLLEDLKDVLKNNKWVGETQEYGGSIHSSQRASKSREVLPVSGSSPSRPVGQQPAVVTMQNNSKRSQNVSKKPKESKAVAQTETNSGAVSANSITRKQASKQKASTSNSTSTSSEAAPSRSAKAKASSASGIPPPAGTTLQSTKPAPKVVEQDDESTQEEVTAAPLPPPEPAAPKKKRDQLRDTDGQLPSVTTPLAISATNKSRKVRSTKGDNVSPTKGRLKQYSRSPTKLAASKPKQSTTAKQLAKTPALVTPATKAAMNENVEDQEEATVIPDVFDVPDDEEEEPKPKPKPKTAKKGANKTNSTKGKATSTAKGAKVAPKSNKKVAASKKTQVTEQPRRRSSRTSGQAPTRYNDEAASEQEDEGVGDNPDDQATDDEQDGSPTTSKGRAAAGSRKDTRQSMIKTARDKDADELMQDAADDREDDVTVVTDKGRGRQKASSNVKPAQPVAPASNLARRTAHTPRPEPRSAVAKMTETNADLLPADSNKPQLVTFTANGPANQGMRSASREHPGKVSTREQAAIHGEADEADNDLDMDGFRPLADEVVDDVAPVLERDDPASGIDVTLRQIEQDTRLPDVLTHANMNDTTEIAPDMFTETQVPASPNREGSPSGATTQAETAQDSSSTTKIEDSIGNNMPYLSIPQNLAAPPIRDGNMTRHSNSSMESNQQPSYYWKSESAQKFIRMNLPADTVSTVTEHLTAGLSPGVVHEETLDDVEGHSLVTNNTAPAGTVDPRMLSQHTMQSMPTATQNLHLAVRTETEVSPGHIRVTEHELDIQREVKRPASDMLQADHIKRARVVEVQDDDEDESQGSPEAPQPQPQVDLDNEQHEIEQMIQQEIQPAAQHGNRHGTQYQDQQELEHDGLSLPGEPNQEAQSSPLSEAQFSSQEVEEEGAEEDIDEPDKPEVQYVSPILSQSKTVTATGSPLPRDDRVPYKPSLQPPPSRQAVSGPGKSAMKDDSQRSAQTEKKSVRIDEYAGAPMPQQVQQSLPAPKPRNTTASVVVVAQQQLASLRAPDETSVLAKAFVPPIESKRPAAALPIAGHRKSNSNPAAFGAPMYEEQRRPQTLDHKKSTVDTRKDQRLPQSTLEPKKQSANTQNVGWQHLVQSSAKHQAPIQETVQHLPNPGQSAGRSQPTVLAATTAARAEPAVSRPAPQTVQHPMLPPILPLEADDVFRPQEVKPLSKFQQSLLKSTLPVAVSPLPATKPTGMINWDDHQDAEKGRSAHNSSGPRSINDHSAEHVPSSSDPASMDSNNLNNTDLNEDHDDNDEEMDYSSDSSDDDDSENDSTTLIEDTIPLPTVPAYELDLLNSLTAITDTYTAHIFGQEKRTIELLVAYERGGLDMVTQFGTCRQEEVATAEQEIKQVKKETSEELERVVQELKKKQGEANDLRKEMREMEKRMQGGMKRESEALKELFALC